MKKIMLFLFLIGAGLTSISQNQINMIWCGSKEAGKLDAVSLTSECMTVAPQFWIPGKGELKCLGFKMAIGDDKQSIVLVSKNGDFTERMMESFKMNSTASFVHFFDVIVQSPDGSTELSDTVYKIRLSK
jgi:hypothetical protein